MPESWLENQINFRELCCLQPITRPQNIDLVSSCRKHDWDRTSGGLLSFFQNVDTDQDRELGDNAEEHHGDVISEVGDAESAVAHPSAADGPAELRDVTERHPLIVRPVHLDDVDRLDRRDARRLALERQEARLQQRLASWQ